MAWACLRRREEAREGELGGACPREGLKTSSHFQVAFPPLLPPACGRG